MGGHWNILTTAGRNTLKLAASLAEDGFEVWTPQRAVKIRKPRWNVHRAVTVPLMAGFVFASERHLIDLLGLASQPNRMRRGAGRLLPAHPEFSVFLAGGLPGRVEDSELDPLRDEASAAQTPAELQHLFRKGEGVNVSQGIFGGMAGIVERVDGTFTLVRFGSRMRVKISTSILEPNVAQRGRAARKAA